MSTTFTKPQLQQIDQDLWSWNDSVNKVYTKGKSNGYVLTIPAHTVYRDKNRYVFAATNGYMPQYPYSSSVYKRKLYLPGVLSGQRNSDQKSVGAAGSFGIRKSATDFGTTHVDANTLATTLHNQISSGLHGRVRDQYYSVFETVYEGRKTIKMVANAARTIALSMRDIRRGRFLSASRRLGLNSIPKRVGKSRSAQDNWLEYRYGWQPLISTVYGEMRRQYDHIRSKPAFRVVSAQKSGGIPPVNYLSAESSNLAEPGYIGPCYIKTAYQSLYEVDCKQTWYYRVTNPGVANATELGITNPALVAWEAVPLSFVADWFVNVSDCLAQFDSFSGKTFLTGTKTTCTRSKHTAWSIKTRDVAGYSVYRFQPSKAIHENFNVSRVVLTSPPSIRLEFSNGLTPSRVVDAVSLLAQQFMRKL